MALGNFSQQFSDEVHARIRDQMVSRAVRVKKRAQQLAPYKTGDLMRSIYFTVDDEGYSVKFYVGMPYGLFQEYGTRNIPPHPYLRPAINEEFELYGVNSQMVFTQVPKTDMQLLARGGKFEMGKGLTEKQKEHVRTKLKPVSETLHGPGQHVSRARLVVRRKNY